MALKTRIPKLQRTVKAAYFSGGLGPVTADELLAMPEDQWRHLRNQLTDNNRDPTRGLSAVCLQCGSPVFIRNSRTARLPGKLFPYFEHYRGGDPACPWYTGGGETPDDIRAKQYQGRQVSPAHEMLCATIAELSGQDTRTERVEIERYHKPGSSEHGRFPDVLVQWKDRQPFVFEIQLSNTFQTEISDRSLYYGREGCDLIWILYGLNEAMRDLPASFRDVIHRHRNNAFVLDQAAINASREKQELVLSAHLAGSDGTFSERHLVTLDQLEYPENGLPFFRDKITPGFFAEYRTKRMPWLKGLETWDHYHPESPDFQAAFAPFETRLATDSLSHLCVARLVGALFSITATANGKPRNYISRDPNIGGMLNSKLRATGKGGLAKFAHIIEHAIVTTKIQSELPASVTRHLDDAKATEQVPPNSPAWEIAAHVLPELFDMQAVDQLDTLGALPSWINCDGLQRSRHHIEYQTTSVP